MDIFNNRIPQKLKKIQPIDECFIHPINVKDYDKLVWEMTFVNNVNSISMDLLRNKQWSLVTPNDGTSRFVTSDNPVVVYLPKEYRPMKEHTLVGIETKMVQIFLPLSRNLLLQIVDSRYWSNLTPISKITVDVDRVNLMNRLQEQQAIYWIFIGDK